MQYNAAANDNKYKIIEIMQPPPFIKRLGLAPSPKKSRLNLNDWNNLALPL